MTSRTICLSTNTTDSSSEPVVVATATNAPNTSPTVGRRSRKPRSDPNAPKRECSAFILFSQAERACVKGDYPEATDAELLKRLGEKWKVADSDTKARYTALYASNKLEADESWRAYAGAVGD